MYNTITLDLTLFSVATPVQTTALNSSGNDLSPEMKVFYAKNLLENLKKDTVYCQFAEKYPIPAHNGNTMRFRRMNKFAPATTPLTEGVTPTGTALDFTEFDVPTYQYGAFTVLSDRVQTEAIDPILAEAVSNFSDQAYETLDILDRDVLCGGTQVVYAPKIVSGNKTAVTVRSGIDATALFDMDLVYEARRLLKRAGVKTRDGDYIAIVHPDVAKDIRKLNDWIEAQKYQNSEKIYNGEIGKFENIRFIESNNAPIWKASSSAVAVYGTVVIGKGAFGEIEISQEGLDFIVKQLGSGGTEDPLNQRGTAGWKKTHAVARLSEESIVRIESSSSSQATAESNT